MYYVRLLENKGSITLSLSLFNTKVVIVYSVDGFVFYTTVQLAGSMPDLLFPSRQILGNIIRMYRQTVKNASISGF
jgi:hypothetical protein